MRDYPHPKPQADYREYVIVRTQTGIYGGRVVDRNSLGYLILDKAVRFHLDGDVSKPFTGYLELAERSDEDYEADWLAEYVIEGNS